MSEVKDNQNQPDPTAPADAPGAADAEHLDANDIEAELWDELDQAEAAATDGDDDQAPEASGSQDAEAGQEAAADAGYDDLEGSADQRPSDGDQPSDEAGQTPDIWGDATPEQKAAFEAAEARAKKLEQAERSNRGRLSALQRQINDLIAKQQQAAPVAAQPQPGEDQGDDNPLNDPEFKRAVEEYPEVAAPLAKVLGKVLERNTRLEKEMAAVGVDRRQAALNEQAAILADQHPDWQDIGATPEFVDWVHAQPRHIQEAAYRNATEIVDAAEAADLVGRFKEFRAGGRSGNTPTPRTGAAGPGTQTNQLAGKRQRQLESASAARSRGPGAASGIPKDGDPETLWKQMDELERRAARA